MTYYLYNAGMAQDEVFEQICLAASEDENNFHRVGDTLLIPVDSAKPWKDSCTCNPTVLVVDGRFLISIRGFQTAGSLH